MLFKKLVNYCFKEINIIRKMCDEAIIKKPKYDGRSKKRKWEDRRSDKGEIVDGIKKEKSEERVKRKKYALLLGYSGANYYGMQRNPTMKTIEEELFKALLQANLITDDAFKQIQTIQYQRAARTDKGVSAARQVVSIKLPECMEIDKVNATLPEEVRLFGFTRVTKGFNSKSHCDARTYLYMLPTFAFSECTQEINQEAFRLNEISYKKINTILGKFIGTKNYHNFTSKKKSNDPSANRYIMDFYCEKPFLSNNIEFAVLKVKGQSFMMHQIRKMVGLTIAMVKGHLTEETFKKAFTTERVNVPRAPGLGLVLDFVHYDRYNRRYGDDGCHRKLEWDELNDVVQVFKEKYIYPTIVETEIAENSMLDWITQLERHNYDIPEDDEEEEEEEDDKNNEENECSDNENNLKSSTTTTTTQAAL